MNRQQIHTVLTKKASILGRIVANGMFGNTILEFLTPGDLSRLLTTTSMRLIAAAPVVEVKEPSRKRQRVETRVADVKMTDVSVIPANAQLDAWTVFSTLTRVYREGVRGPFPNANVSLFAAASLIRRMYLFRIETLNFSTNGLPTDSIRAINAFRAQVGERKVGNNEFLTSVLSNLHTLIIHEAYGLTEDWITMADRLAEMASLKTLVIQAHQVTPDATATALTAFLKSRALPNLETLALVKDGYPFKFAAEDVAAFMAEHEAIRDLRIDVKWDDKLVLRLFTPRMRKLELNARHVRALVGPRKEEHELAMKDIGEEEKEEKDHHWPRVTDVSKMLEQLDSLDLTTYGAHLIVQRGQPSVHRPESNVVPRNKPTGIRIRGRSTPWYREAVPKWIHQFGGHIDRLEWSYDETDILDLLLQQDQVKSISSLAFTTPEFIDQLPQLTQLVKSKVDHISLSELRSTIDIGHMGNGEYWMEGGFDRGYGYSDIIADTIKSMCGDVKDQKHPTSLRRLNLRDSPAKLNSFLTTIQRSGMEYLRIDCHETLEMKTLQAILAPMKRLTQLVVYGIDTDNGRFDLGKWPQMPDLRRVQLGLDWVRSTTLLLFSNLVHFEISGKATTNKDATDNKVMAQFMKQNPKLEHCYLDLTKSNIESVAGAKASVHFPVPSTLRVLNIPLGSSSVSDEEIAAYQRMMAERNELVFRTGNDAVPHHTLYTRDEEQRAHHAIWPAGMVDMPATWDEINKASMPPMLLLESELSSFQDAERDKSVHFFGGYYSHGGQMTKEDCVLINRRTKSYACVRFIGTFGYNSIHVNELQFDVKPESTKVYPFIPAGLQHDRASQRLTLTTAKGKIHGRTWASLLIKLWELNPKLPWDTVVDFALSGGQDSIFDRANTIVRIETMIAKRAETSAPWQRSHTKDEQPDRSVLKVQWQRPPLGEPKPTATMDNIGATDDVLPTKMPDMRTPADEEAWMQHMDEFLTQRLRREHHEPGASNRRMLVDALRHATPQRSIKLICSKPGCHVKSAVLDPQTNQWTLVMDPRHSVRLARLIENVFQGFRPMSRVVIT